MTHTKDRLAAELRKLGLNDMAQRAEAGYYDDYLSPLPDNIGQLVHDLLETAASLKDDSRVVAILTLRQRAINGDFDGSTAESEAWAASPEGRAAQRALMRHKE